MRALHGVTRPVLERGTSRVAVVDPAHLGAHAVFGDHATSGIGRPLQVVSRSGPDLLEHSLLSCDAAEQYADVVDQFGLRRDVFVIVGTLQHVPECPESARDDRDLMDGIGVGEAARDEGVA